MGRRRPSGAAWAKRWQRQLLALLAPATRGQRSSSARSRAAIGHSARLASQVRPGAGDWLAGLALGPSGARRFRLFRPAGLRQDERLPLLVMLHGCGQDANSFARSTRMNALAARERFLVLYPEQDRLANLQGCWNWFDTDSGRAYGEAALILQAIDQVCLLHPADRTRVAVAGLSSGASMAALLASHYPTRFKAVVMHSGIAPGAVHSRLGALGAMQGARSLRPPSAQALAMARLRPPLLVIQGRADAVVAASNGRAAAQHWTQGASATAGRQRQRGQRYAATVTDFKRQQATLTTLVEVERLGHAWSGGAASQPFSDARGPDASRMVWAFAARQFRG